MPWCTLRASRTSSCVLEWRVEKEALPESPSSFEVAAERIFGLDNLVSHLILNYSSAKHLFSDKPMVMSEPSVPSARIIGLGSNLSRSNMQSMLNKDPTRSHAESFSLTPKSSKGDLDVDVPYFLRSLSKLFGALWRRGGKRKRACN